MNLKHLGYALFANMCALMGLVGASIAQEAVDPNLQNLREQIIILQEELSASRVQNVQLRMRLDSESQDRRRLQGEIEEIDFRLSKLQRRFDDLIGDLDLRLQEIEEARVTVQPPQSETAGEVLTEAESSASPESAEQTSPEEDQTLGVLVQDENGNVVGAELVTKPSFSERYEAAIILIQQADYVGAREKLQVLNTEDANHPLSSNVLYWIGETYFIESKFRHAMSNFAKSALNFPDGAKYFDSLLKVGISLGNLGRTDQACATLKDLGIKTEKALPSEILVAQKEALRRFACAQ